MTASSENKTERVQLLMSPSEVEAIDNWGFSNRIRTRAESIRRLCQIGMAFNKNSSEIRVMAHFISKIMSERSEDINEAKTENELIEIYSQIISEFIHDTNALIKKIGAVDSVDVILQDESLIKNMDEYFEKKLDQRYK